MIAHNMVKEKEKLMKINLNHQKVSLKISIGNGDYALKPIYHILNQQSFQDEINITILNLAVWDALESLYQQTIDLAYLIIPAFMKKEMIAYCQNHHLLFNQLIYVKIILYLIICEVRHLEDKKNLLFDEFHQIIENDIQNYF